MRVQILYNGGMGCFQIADADNVATLLADAKAGLVPIHGKAGLGEIQLIEPIKMGHKVALRAIADGAAVVKYGVTIGVATRPIAAGEWVHLHNCRSLCDAVSSSLDHETGARNDTQYA
jgi:altronate dehydratase small subunit